MANIFTTPIQEITVDQVHSLIGIPEGQTVEFKEKLSGKDGRDDTWMMPGGKVGEFAREKLLKEVVAFANTSGGHVILGIEEEAGPPPVAASVAPVPRCIELAERLSQMADRIEPPIPMLQVWGVPVDGEAGVVIFRVPASRSAPHRALDKECYVRRGTASVPIGMREIQDMTLASSARGEWTRGVLRRASDEFTTWMATPVRDAPSASGIRVTAVPASGPFSLSRLFGHQDLFQPAHRLSVTTNGHPFHVNGFRIPQRRRSILRGVRYAFSEEDNPYFIDLRSDGSVMSGIQFHADETIRGRRIYAPWIVTAVFNALKAANALRAFAQLPEAEYAVEVEVAARAGQSVDFHLWGTGFDDRAGQVNTPLALDGLSFGAWSEVAPLISSVLTDLRDAAGTYSEAPMTLNAVREG